MTEYIVKTDRNGKSHIKVKFHAPVAHFKRVENFKHNGKFYKVYINKYNCVHNLEQSVVVSWKEVEKGKKKFRVPDIIKSIPMPYIMNIVRGNHYETAMERIMTELNKEIIS